MTYRLMNALSCCVLRFVELTAVDQAAPIETYLSRNAHARVWSAWLDSNQRPTA